MAKEPNTDEPDFIYDVIREDGRLERTCRHGVGHTVGHRSSGELAYDHTWIHGCDGCCRDYKKMKAGQKVKELISHGSCLACDTPVYEKVEDLRLRNRDGEFHICVVYTVPLHVGKIVRVPKGSKIVFY